MSQKTRIRVTEFKPNTGASGPYLTIQSMNGKWNFFRNSLDKGIAEKQASNYDDVASSIQRGNTYDCEITQSGKFSNILSMELVATNQLPPSAPQSSGPLPSWRYNLIDLLAASKIAATVLSRDSEEIVTTGRVLDWAESFVNEARKRAKEMDGK